MEEEGSMKGVAGGVWWLLASVEDGKHNDNDGRRQQVGRPRGEGGGKKREKGKKEKERERGKRKESDKNEFKL